MIKLNTILLELKGIKKLYVLDFDDTLVKTKSNIYVIHVDGTKETLTPAEYAVYEQKPGDKFDFSDFQKMLRKPNPINKNIKLLMRFMKAPNSKVTILTARSLAFPIRYYLKKQYGIDVYTVALGDSNPQKKADWIEDHIKKGYDDIFFMDDSPKNVHAVDRLKEKYPNIKLQTVHVKDNHMSEEKLNEFQAQGFDLNLFLDMTSFATQVRYANEKLKRIAQGSARVIFEIDDKTVLKLAKNAKGLAQNEVEAGLSNDYMVPEDIIAKVLEYDEGYRWIVMERAKKISSGRFKQLMDGVDILIFYYYIRNQTDRLGNKHWSIKDEIKEKLDKNEFAQDIIEMSNNFELEVGDFGRPSSFGEIDGRLVLTDYGLTQEVYRKYYDRSRKSNN